MNNATFKPLRKIKKTDKITVASYIQWRKILISDKNCDWRNEKFNLVIDNEYKTFNSDELVYNYKGEVLFWYNYKNPESLPKNYINIEQITELLGKE